MASTYSSGLRLEKPATGDKRGTWGTMANTGYDLIDDAVGGYVSIAMSDANTTLTANNGSSDQSRNAFIKLTGTLTATREIVVPTAEKTWWFWNGTTGSQSITVKTTAGTGVTIAAGMVQKVACDGTNVVALSPAMAASTGLLAAVGGGTGISSYAVGDILYAATTTTLAKLAGVATGNALISGGVSTAPSWGKVGLTTHVSGTLPVANGGTGVTTSTGTGNVVLSTSPTLTTPALGTPSAAVLTNATGLPLTTGVTGTLPVANGGTGAVTFTSGEYLKGNGTGAITSSATITGSDVSGNISGNAANVTGTVAIANGGTGQTTAANAINALVPTQTGNSGKVLKTDGSVVSWADALQSYFTEAQSTASPNNTIYVSSLTATGAATHIDFAILPKGNGAILMDVPDSGTGGGNKRGTNAVDLQVSRNSAANVASGALSAIIGGADNTASATASGVFVGGDNTASADYAAVLGGTNNIASGQSSVAIGDYATTRGITGATAHGSSIALSAGAAQTRTFVLARQTTDATPVVLTTTGSAQGSANSIILPSDSTFFFEARIVARRTDADDESAAYILQGCIDNNAGTTALVGSVTKTVIAEDTAGWDVSATADDANNTLLITVTGENAKTISWVAHVRTVEVVG